jgi:hypothetical protein
MSTPVNESSDHYIHGATPEQQRRLSRLNDLLNEASLRELGLSGGERILDVGSGLAQFWFAMCWAQGIIPENHLARSRPSP